MKILSAYELRTGMTIQYDDNLYEVLDVFRIKPGKARPIVKTTLIDLTNYEIIEKTFDALENFVDYEEGEDSIKVHC